MVHCGDQGPKTVVSKLGINGPACSRLDILRFEVNVQPKCGEIAKEFKQYVLANGMSSISDEGRHHSCQEQRG